jgi:hypothetical protein
LDAKPGTLKRRSFRPPGILTPHAKRMIATSTYTKGKAFIAAAMLLVSRAEKNEAFGYVVLHLLCQGTELILKGIMLLTDYDKYHPERLRDKVRHNLATAAQWAISATGAKPLRPAMQAELETLNRLYQNHLLRYGSVFDILVTPSSITSTRVLRRMAAVIRLTDRVLLRLTHAAPAPSKG